MGIDIDPPDTDWQEMAELVETSYRQIVLERQLLALDARIAGPNASDEGTASALV